ncbi:uncharacterized protein LOC101177817 isoform X1 [Nomascus leucogenys]|uniref:uncharacterized protein LOC101177817 isoform X1 n=1 Tax=Nomascus leucogenys TaxID=61853 RepID=UPI00122DBF17|nr:uncharacterized protein LOC101177817 isoform X1 [Nomascus leucogenys]
MTAAPDRLTFRAPPARVRFSLFPRVRVQPIVFKEKLTMKTDSWMEEKLECSLWCCLSDPSPPGRCCVPERRIVPWMQQLLLSRMKKVSQQFGRLSRADHEVRRSRPSWLTR